MPNVRALHSITPLLAAIAWQGYVAYRAHRQAVVLAQLLPALGVAVPKVTAAFLASADWWAAVPVVFAVMAADILRRAGASPMYSRIVTASAFAAAVVLQTWCDQAWFEPMLTMIRSVG